MHYAVHTGTAMHLFQYTFSPLKPSFEPPQHTMLFSAPALVWMPAVALHCQWPDCGSGIHGNTCRGESFHFAHQLHGETLREAIKRHEHYLALKLGIGKGHKVLDVGCGVGGPLREIAMFSGATVTGLNNNEYQVRFDTAELIDSDVLETKELTKRNGAERESLRPFWKTCDFRASDSTFSAWPRAS